MPYQRVPGFDTYAKADILWAYAAYLWNRFPPRVLADMDVDSMKKTSTRLATIGGLILLGACAIAAAQFSSRSRDHEYALSHTTVAEQTSPIEVEGDWGMPDSRLPGTNPPGSNAIVRGNNDGMTSYAAQLPELDSAPDAYAESTDAYAENIDAYAEDANPLRGDDADAFEHADGSHFELPSAEQMQRLAADFAGYESTGEDQSVALVAGEAPTDPPAWMNAPTAPPPAASNRTPQLPAVRPNAISTNTLPSTGGLQAPAMPATTMQSLPTFPTVGATPANQTPALPKTNAPMTSDRPTITNEIGNMSDTQRGVMSATDLFPNNQNLPNGGASPQGNRFLTPPQMPAAGAEAPTSNPAYGNFSNSNALLPGNGPRSGANNALDYTGNQYGVSQNAAAVNAAPNSATLYPAIPSNPPQDTQSANESSGSNAFPAAAGQPSSTASMSQAAYGNSRISTALVSNQPGNRYLDGSQNPVMQIQKRAPEEIQVGKPATFVITVRNAGNATAHEVTVVDSVPRGARFVAAMPTASPDPNKMLTWKLGEIAAGDERTINLQIIPEVQGEVGSVATVHFAAQASVRTIATMSKLEIELESRSDVVISDAQEINVIVRNSGTGVARDVRLEADIPVELRHESGDAQLAAQLGDIRPNETKRLTLVCSAVQPGQSACIVRAVTDDGVQAEEKIEVDVRAPQLIAAIQGPKIRYLERQATYQIAVKNIGTSTATNLDFTVHLPAGLKFNGANNGGSYQPESHSVVWGLEALPATTTPAEMELVVLPVELGEQVISFAARGDLNVSAEAKAGVTVDGLAKLAFTIDQDNGTIEAGASSTYSVQVTNVGNKSDRNVRLMVELPAGTQLLDVNAPVQYELQGSVLMFAPIDEMRNKDQHTYRFQIKHNQAGTQVVRTKLTSDNWPVAIVKEVGTLVYNDQQ